MRSGTFKTQIEALRTTPKPKLFTVAARNGLGEFDHWKREFIGLGINPASLPTLQADPRSLSTVILIHGLGQDPRAMDCWSDILAGRGVNVLNILLSGHGSGTRGLAQASLSRWRRDIARATELAKSLTDDIHLWGFSLGATLALDAILRHPTEYRGATLLSAGLGMSEMWQERVDHRSRIGESNLTDFRLEQKYEPLPLTVLEHLNQAITDVISLVGTVSPAKKLPPIGFVTASRDQVVDAKVAEEVACRLRLPIWKLPISEHNLMDSGLDLLDIFKFAQNQCGLRTF